MYDNQKEEHVHSQYNSSLNKHITCSIKCKINYQIFSKIKKCVDAGDRLA